ncbi:hypothetical protein X977_4922 [Burkholderia pseudomallei MSHR7504]|nr:hypothetical protein X977_4922 [Burkholderia pseudomallei MSHR7504]
MKRSSSSSKPDFPFSLTLGPVRFACRVALF